MHIPFCFLYNCFYIAVSGSIITDTLLFQLNSLIFHIFQRLNILRLFFLCLFQQKLQTLPVVLRQFFP